MAQFFHGVADATAVGRQPMIQIASPLQEYLQELCTELTSLRDGEVASYIPELSHSHPEWFGIAIATVDGHVYQAGDTQLPFTIQSISKAIAYGLALEDNGMERVQARVGVEPSGEAFNSISLEAQTGRPMNPMINAGAIATSGLILDDQGKKPIQRLIAAFERYTGHGMTIDEKVYRSERETGHRNRAIAHLLYGYGILDRTPEEVLDIYFRQCSILVTARDLALMGACLANNGVNPVTGVTALNGKYVEKVLSVMSSCGMYDYSGSWLHDVGLPAKSGVGGGIMAVLPGQFGLGVFSPPLDAKGNSVRGIAACRRISEDLQLHVFNVVRSTSASVIRVHYDGSKIRSHRWRGMEENRVLDEQGSRVHVFELQGELKIGSAESVVEQIIAQAAEFEFLIVDLKKVSDLDRAASQIFTRLARTLQQDGRHVFFANTHDLYPFTRYLSRHLPEASGGELLRFEDTDRALEWCENRIIQRADTGTIAAGIDIRDQYLCQNMTEAEISQLLSVGRMIRFAKGEVIFRAGESADSFFFILEGKVDVTVSAGLKREIRLATLGSGTAFGEVSILNERRRAADVTAARDTECLEVNFDDLDAGVKTKLLLNLASQLSHKIYRDAREIRYLG
jgi:glutaminase